MLCCSTASDFRSWYMYLMNKNSIKNIKIHDIVTGNETHFTLSNTNLDVLISTYSIYQAWSSCDRQNLNSISSWIDLCKKGISFFKCFMESRHNCNNNNWHNGLLIKFQYEKCEWIFLKFTMAVVLQWRELLALDVDTLTICNVNLAQSNLLAGVLMCRAANISTRGIYAKPRRTHVVYFHSHLTENNSGILNALILGML